jgi:hypothetical protein
VNGSTGTKDQNTDAQSHFQERHAAHYGTRFLIHHLENSLRSCAPIVPSASASVPHFGTLAQLLTH